MEGINRSITSVCVAGVLVSTYALYVELTVEAKPGYKALCDIAQHASCTKVLSSPFAKGLGLVSDDSQFKLPNCLYGIIYFCFMILLTTFNGIEAVRVQKGISIACLAVCVYLLYILVFILRDFCIVCVMTYIVNILILLLLSKKYKLLKAKGK